MLWNYALAAVITDGPYEALKSVFMTSAMRSMIMVPFFPLMMNALVSCFQSGSGLIYNPDSIN